MTQKKKQTFNVAHKKDKRYYGTLEVCAGGVVVDGDGKILLVRSHKWDGKYSIPGGHVEYGESLEKALVREIKEEMGIDVKVVAWLPPSELITPRRHFLFTNAACLYEGAKDAVKPCKDEFDGEPIWFDVDEALAQPQELASGVEVLLKSYKAWRECTEALAGWRRCLADFDNYKKRQAESAKIQMQYAAQDMVTRLLPVLDNFHASIAHVPTEHAESPWVTGLNYIYKQLNDVLAESGVTVIAVSPGDIFDPAKHEAIEGNAEDKDTETQDDEYGDTKEQKITKVVSQGYMMGEKVLRPARVVVK